MVFLHIAPVAINKKHAFNSGLQSPGDNFPGLPSPFLKVNLSVIFSVVFYPSKIPVEKSSQHIEKKKRQNKYNVF